MDIADMGGLGVAALGRTLEELLREGKNNTNRPRH
jgi:hypothetical protein